MAANVEVRDIQEGDAEALLADIRPADLIELQASCRGDLLEAIKESIASAPHRWCVTVDGDLAALIGVTRAPRDPEVGIPWMSGTSAFYRAPRALTRLGRHYSAFGLSIYHTLVNYVDVRNTVSIRWLKAMGYTVADEPLPVGVNGELFYRFSMSRIRPPCAGLLLSPPPGL
ncbi:hypothetical protein CAL26_09990 [Bordetella genomosp. 9]|uniref:N-acetyltransferase domain-containing protein n=1 Tax=Bordetella genomosp. 9 TaxID=1416803 RepID=A0A261RFP4_9BORD|nr:hypothetical protein [Bordetella genomosp. 9]OZI23751.1 hypothetical protein CAL26_09990 [Bordetella genomosp. 9]